MKMRVLAALIAAGLSTSAWSLTDQEIISGIQFSFNNPGARSLGMAGAFLGFSDDATAAFTNPAGLTTLSTQELALEGRYFDYAVDYVSGGTATLPSLTGLEYRTARDETAELAFLSYVYPGENWALAAYRQVAASYQNSFVRDDVDFAAPGLSLPGEPPGTVYTLFAVGGLVDLEIINYGASFAYEFSDKLSLGVSGIYSTSDLRSVSVRLNGANEGNGGQDEKFVFNLGMLYRLSDSLSLGASYRHGASFDIRAITFQGLTPEGGVANSATEFNVPHQLGVGLAWRPNDSLSVGLEVNHIRYSRLDLDPFRFTGTGLPGAKIAADDGTEIRLGGEYVFLNMNRPFIVRAGIWHDPDHRVGYQSPNPPANIAQAATRILFPQGDDELHYSLGFGWAFDQFQVDVGADLSDLTDIYSLSGVVRF